MSAITTELPDFNWPLVAGLGIVAALIVYAIYVVTQQSGATQATKSAASVVTGAAGLINDVTGGVGSAVSTLAPSAADSANPASNSSLFYAGVSNFFSTGSIYGN